MDVGPETARRQEPLPQKLKEACDGPNARSAAEARLASRDARNVAGSKHQHACDAAKAMRAETVSAAREAETLRIGLEYARVIEGLCEKCAQDVEATESLRQAEAIASKCTEAVCAQRDECENATNEALAQLEAGSSAAAAPAAAAPSV